MGFKSAFKVLNCQNLWAFTYQVAHRRVTPWSLVEGCRSFQKCLLLEIGLSTQTRNPNNTP